MKRNYILVILLFNIAFSAKAQSKAVAQIQRTVDQLREAMISGNKTDLENIASKSLSYGHSSGKIEDKAAFVESIASGRSDFNSIDLTDQTITVSGKTALVHHKLFAKTNDGGNTSTVSLGVLLVFQKLKGQWKLLARQAYKL